MERETPTDLASVENAYDTGSSTITGLARTLRRALLALAMLSALAMTLFWAGLTPPR
jgi:hypothetical protein